ncbi:MAG TPA: DUF1614 domain-containing protein [Desulfobacterales bacterium]
MFYNPIAFLFVILFFFSLVFLFVFVQINLIAVAFAEIGIPSQYVFAALFATLLGSFVNIPIKRIPQEQMHDGREVLFMGVRYRIPLPNRNETILAVNLGGAVIPSLICLYLLFKTGLWISSGLAVAVMAAITYRLARPVRGVGIALPAFVPPILAAVVGVILADQSAPVIAYIAGTLGTLIGADVLHMNKIAKLGAPVASIGGAGTWDGIFLNGILAVILAAVFT